MQHGATGQREDWPLRCDGPQATSAGGSEYGLDLISQAALNSAGPRRMENKHQDRPEEERKVSLEAVDITEQKTRISTIKAAVGYTRLG